MSLSEKSRAMFTRTHGMRRAPLWARPSSPNYRPFFSQRDSGRSKLMAVIQAITPIAAQIGAEFASSA